MREFVQGRLHQKACFVESDIAGLRTKAQILRRDAERFDVSHSM